MPTFTGNKLVLSSEANRLQAFREETARRAPQSRMLSWCKRCTRCGEPKSPAGGKLRGGKFCCADCVKNASA